MPSSSEKPGPAGSDRSKNNNTIEQTSIKSGSRVSRGRAFERQAAQFFTDQGYEILEQNWQASHKELDLIVRKNDTVVFVEVKAGWSRKYGHPIERIDRKKIRNLTEAAQRYIEEKSLTDCDFRFDVVTFFEGQLEHFPNAFGTD